MPNYKGTFGHRNATLLLAATTSTIPVLSGDVLTAFIPAGVLLGLWMTPDWDLNRRKVSLLEKAQFLDEYAILVSHRSAISHTPVLGTFIRFALTFSAPLLIVALVTKWLPPFRVLACIFSGLCLSDSLHVSMDYIDTALKTRVRRIRRGRRNRS